MQDDSFDYESFLNRQQHLFNEAEQESIKTSNILIAGIGANGAPCAEILARMGAMNLTLVDHDHVEISNLNRQPYNVKDIGEKKVVALANRLQKFSPRISISTIDNGITHENVKKLVQCSDIVVDAVDDYRMKVSLCRTSNSLKKPVVHTAGAGYRGSVTTFWPSEINYEEMFNLPSKGRRLSEVSENEFSKHRKKVAKIIGIGMYKSNLIEKMDDLSEAWQTIAPNCVIAGTLGAMEVIKIIIGKKELCIIAPEILQVDVMKGHFKRFTLSIDGESSYS